MKYFSKLAITVGFSVIGLAAYRLDGATVEDDRFGHLAGAGVLLLDSLALAGAALHLPGRAIHESAVADLDGDHAAAFDHRVDVQVMSGYQLWPDRDPQDRARHRRPVTGRQSPLAAVGRVRAGHRCATASCRGN